jgi:N-acetylglutamate synthase-like GNAT family acetyltransferase
MIVRNEQQDDESVVATVVERAFGRADVARLVGQLRTDGDAVISVVAVIGGIAVGQVMLSRMVAPFRALALAPVSVAPEHQRRGIGSSLVKEGLKQAREQEWEAVFVLGAPARAVWIPRGPSSGLFVSLRWTSLHGPFARCETSSQSRQGRLRPRFRGLSVGNLSRTDLLRHRFQTSDFIH